MVATKKPNNVVTLPVTDPAKAERFDSLGKAATDLARLLKARGIQPDMTNKNTASRYNFLIDLLRENALTSEQLETRLFELRPDYHNFESSLLGCINIDSVIDSATAPDYLINGLLETDSHGILSGSSMAFKTFAALRFAHSVCTGKEFFGRQVFNAGKVLYICGEGQGALMRRLKALKLTDGDFNENFILIEKPLRVDNAVDMTELRKLIDYHVPALVVFDTFASLVSTTDENSPSDVGRVLRLIKETCRNGKTSSLIIHHHGKDASKGSRGASNFLNDVDFAFEMNRATHAMLATLSCKKMKDGCAFDDIHMQAEVVDLGLINQDGSICTSLVMKPTDYTPKKKENLSERQKAVLHELYAALDKHGVEPPPEVKEQFAECPNRLPQKVVSSEKWRELAYKVIAVDSSSKDVAQAKRKSFSRCAEILKAAKKVNFYDGYYWIC